MAGSRGESWCSLIRWTIVGVVWSFLGLWNVTSVVLFLEFAWVERAFMVYFVSLASLSPFLLKVLFLFCLFVWVCFYACVYSCFCVVVFMLCVHEWCFCVSFLRLLLEDQFHSFRNKDFLDPPLSPPGLLQIHPSTHPSTLKSLLTFLRPSTLFRFPFHFTARKGKSLPDFALSFSGWGERGGLVP